MICRVPAGRWCRALATADDASCTTIARTGRIDRVLSVVASALLRQQAFAIAEHHTVFFVPERATVQNGLISTLALHRQFGQRDRFPCRLTGFGAKPFACLYSSGEGYQQNASERKLGNRGRDRGVSRHGAPEEKERGPNWGANPLGLTRKFKPASVHQRHANSKHLPNL